MFPSRDRLILCALTLALAGGPLTAGEVQADLACFHRHHCGKPCYDPCEPVGPIRRFFRRVFRVPCPPPVVAVPMPVTTAPVCGPGVPAPPPVGVGRPVPVNPPIDVPPAPPAPFTGSSGRPPRLTPPTPPAPVPVRLDRLASRTGEAGSTFRAAAPQGPIEVTFIHATRRGERVRVTADRDGVITRTLEPGEWLIYTADGEGRLHYRGKVEAREGRPVRLNLREE